MFLIQSTITGCALIWLLYRAWLTLLKPVPELINILGLEVPEPPEVFLAGFKSDTVTLTWTKSGSGRPVHKYLIQVNGVNVGNSQPRETAITVTGLKAGHFYNVRVIAVGNNNFQAGSRVLRFRTFGKDGKPELGSGRIPANFTPEDAGNTVVAESSDEGCVTRAQGAGVETALSEPAPAMVREASGHGSRRNTVARRHSPSTASDHPPLPGSEDNEESMIELTNRFNAIKDEHQSIGVLTIKEKEEFELQMIELLKEKEEKKMMLKEKEEASEKLKKESNISERTNRQAQTRKANKEKALRDKQAERTKMYDDMARWEREIQEMKEEREKWQKDREDLTESTELKIVEMHDILRKRQNSLNGMEEEIRIKGLQLRELEDERKHLPGGEDEEEAEEMEAADRQRELEWENKERILMQKFSHHTQMFSGLKSQLEQARAYQAFLIENQPTNLMFNNAASTGVDLDNRSLQRTRSRRGKQPKSNASSMNAQSMSESNFSGGMYSTYNPTSPSFAPGPFYDMNADLGLHSVSDDMSEAEIKALTGGAPLSPTATSLLPTGLFADDEPPSPRLMERTLGPSLFADDERDSTASSSNSASRISSPRISGNGLQYHQQAVGERSSLTSPVSDFASSNSPVASNAILVPDLQRPKKNNFGELFNFPTRRSKTLQLESPVLGSLKAGQSHSFPRQTDDGDGSFPKNRRTSLSTGITSFLTRGHSDVVEGNAPATSRTATKRRPFKIFNSSIDNPSVGPSDRDPSSPRPASIASSDLPRPSMDSAPFGWSVGSEAVNKNSPLATNWNPNYTPPPGFGAHPWNSHNPSRRPSLQHGSSSHNGGVADDDDEFLPNDVLAQQASPPQVGVIGGPRPQSSMSQAARLNPNAPAFMANLFGRSGKEKASSRTKRENSEDGVDESHSPSDSRKSKDHHSIHTMGSLTESYDSLEQLDSSTTSEAAPSTPQDNALSKLFRKSSSSRFSVGSFKGWSKSKNGTPSNASGDRGSNFDDMVEEVHAEDLLGRSVDSVANSPMPGSQAGSQAGTPREKRSAWNRFSISSTKKDKAKERERLAQHSDEHDDGRMSLTSGAETTEDEKEE